MSLQKHQAELQDVHECCIIFCGKKFEIYETHEVRKTPVYNIYIYRDADFFLCFYKVVYTY